MLAAGRRPGQGSPVQWRCPCLPRCARPLPPSIVEQRAAALVRQGWSSSPCMRQGPAPTAPASPTSAPCRQQVERWRRQRSFIVLVAEDCASGEVLGCAAISLAQVGRRSTGTGHTQLSGIWRTCSCAATTHRRRQLDAACSQGPSAGCGVRRRTPSMPGRAPQPGPTTPRSQVSAPARQPALPPAQPEAALPPPFPTSKPRRVYVSNIAVLPQHRRQGVGSLLLRTCERQARLWRQDSLWLHVELKNADALRVSVGWGGCVSVGGHSGACCQGCAMFGWVSCSSQWKPALAWWLTDSRAWHRGTHSQPTIPQCATC